MKKKLLQTAALFLAYGNDAESFYIPDQSMFQSVGGTAGTDGERKKATRIPITKFTPGQKYSGVILRRTIDKQGQYGTSDLYYLKRVLGGSSQNKNLMLSEDEDLIAIDGNVVLKERMRSIEDGNLVLIEFVGQAAPPKRYKMWNVYVDPFFKEAYPNIVPKRYVAPAQPVAQAPAQPAHPVQPVYGQQQQQYNSYQQQPVQQPVSPTPAYAQPQPQYAQPQYPQAPQYAQPAPNPGYTGGGASNLPDDLPF